MAQRLAQVGEPCLLATEPASLGRHATGEQGHQRQSSRDWHNRRMAGHRAQHRADDAQAAAAATQTAKLSAQTRRPCSERAKPKIDEVAQRAGVVAAAHRPQMRGRSATGSYR